MSLQENILALSAPLSESSWCYLLLLAEDPDSNSSQTSSDRGWGYHFVHRLPCQRGLPGDHSTTVMHSARAEMLSAKCMVQQPFLLRPPPTCGSRVNQKHRAGWRSALILLHCGTLRKSDWSFTVSTLSQWGSFLLCLPWSDLADDGFLLLVIDNDIKICPNKEKYTLLLEQRCFFGY
jgi:hypothetical protein